MSAVVELWRSGGAVMLPLATCAALLWAALAHRALALRAGRGGEALARLAAARAKGAPPTGSTVRDRAVAAVMPLADRPRVHRLDLSAALGPLRGELDEGKVLVRATVTVAPLLGLLGTVMGMIETFQSLADMALYTQGGGVAAGIAEALLTTQLGLVISVPGILIGRALDQRQEHLNHELDALEEQLMLRSAQGVAA
ncbi:MAG: MotA/TolQ/ExbB proton channel family protein [Deltaproteobacteria bacterium]|jgi:biopolymer transport protein ExbB|nr:MotA/TolQ/ExbB proton channel family protein [Deltaproteobacteria bacterium]